jgi:threonylcarbamoyladenosine tRNA methylthiotransferase MtaB
MTVAFKTFGCRLNQAETAQFEKAFTAAGVVRVPFGLPARIIVVHSCAVTQKAENEGLKLLRALRTRWPASCLVLAGCTVEACHAENLRALGLDLIVPREQKDRLVWLTLRHLGLQTPDTPLSPSSLGALPPSRSTQRAALKIQDGCDFFCSYCIVPHTRGRPVSRPFEDCLNEARSLIAAGFQEIVITGCNTACYVDGSHRLTHLLSALTALPGLGRIRLGSIEPGTVEREIIAFMATSDRICRFLHLPVQSGDNGILAAMRRRYTVENVKETLHEALQLMPDLALGADLICGFPGETPEAFERTHALTKELPFSKLHVFPYSERPGTPAAAYRESVPPSERKRRAQILIGQEKRNRQAFAQRFLGHPVELLVERFDKEGTAHGWSGQYLACAVSGIPRDRRRMLCSFTVDAASEGVLSGHRQETQTHPF